MQRVRLHLQPLELHAIQQQAQRRDLTTGIGGVGALGDCHTQAVGIKADLGDKTRCAGGGFIDGAPERLAVTDQGATVSAMPGWAAIHCCSRPSNPSTSS